MADSCFAEALTVEQHVVAFGEVAALDDSKRVPLNSQARAHRKGNYPYYGATSVMDYVDDYLFDGPRILLGEDGSVVTGDGMPVIQYVWGKYWVNNHAHVVRSSSEYSLECLLVALRRTPVAHIVTGAVQKKISQANLNSLLLELPSPDIATQLDPLFDLYRNNARTLLRLEEVRDALLPKLMSGEIDVSQIDLTQLNGHLSDN